MFSTVLDGDGNCPAGEMYGGEYVRGGKYEGGKCPTLLVSACCYVVTTWNVYDNTDTVVTTSRHNPRASTLEL